MKLRNNKSALALIAAGVGGAAIAGFGFTFGKDIYKSSKKNGSALLLLLAVIFCPFIGGRGIIRGHDRGFFSTLFLTYIGSILLIVTGFIIASFLSFSVVIGGVITAFLAGAGFLAGLYQRPKRLQAFAIEKHNEHFLKENGFQETGGRDITHYAPDGQSLRFLEVQPGKLVFMAVGRRGKRAFINLDQDGRMLSYTGIV